MSKLIQLADTDGNVFPTTHLYHATASGTIDASGNMFLANNIIVLAVKPTSHDCLCFTFLSKIYTCSAFVHPTDWTFTKLASGTTFTCEYWYLPNQ